MWKFRRWRTRNYAAKITEQHRPKCGHAWKLARAIQRRRGFYNARIPARLLRTFCALDEAGERTLEMAVRRMGLSARAHDRILKAARTIADLDSSEPVSAKHLAEAVQYRSLDRSYWS